MNWKDIREEIKRMLKEPEDGGHWTDNEILRRANLVQDEICRETKCIIKNAVLVYDEENKVYKVPDKCISVIEILANDKRVFGTTADELDAAYSYSARVWRDEIGEPRTYVKEYNNIVLFPNSQNGSDVVKMKYAGVADDIDSDSAQPFNGIDFLQTACQTLIDGVCFRCFLEDQNEIYATYDKLYSRGLAGLREQLRNNDALESFRNLRRFA